MAANAESAWNARKSGQNDATGDLPAFPCVLGDPGVLGATGALGASLSLAGRTDALIVNCGLS
jgi:hypothetical protein